MLKKKFIKLVLNAFSTFLHQYSKIQHQTIPLKTIQIHQVVVFLTPLTRQILLTMEQIMELTMELIMELIMELTTELTTKLTTQLTTQLMALFHLLLFGSPETIPFLLIVPMQILTMLQFFVIKVFWEMFFTLLQRWMNSGSWISAMCVLMHRHSSTIAYQTQLSQTLLYVSSSSSTANSNWHKTKYFMPGYTLTHLLEVLLLKTVFKTLLLIWQFLNLTVDSNLDLVAWSD